LSISASESIEPAPRRWRLGALEIPGFRLIFVNGLFSSVGMQSVVLVQGWLVLSLSDDSPFWVGVSVALNGIGRMIFSIVGGVLGDQLDRRKVVVAAEFASAAICAVIAATSYLGIATLPLVLATSFVIAGTLAMDMTVTAALIFDVAGRERILNAVSLRRMTAAPMMIGGSLLVGWLIASAGIWAAYAFVSAALVIAPWVLLRLPPPKRASAGGREPFARSAAEGIKFAANHWQIRTLLLVALGMETFGFSYLTMIPVMAKNVLDVDAIGLGQIAAASGVGAGLAVLGIASLGDFRNKPLLVFSTALGAGVSLFAFALSRSLPLSMLCALLTTGFLTAYDITIGSLLQLVSPTHMRGRIISLHNLVIAFASFGGFAAGAIGSLIGVPVMLALGSAAIVSNLLFHRPRLLMIEERAAGDQSARSHPVSRDPDPT
jgi:MFS family permease